MCRTIDHYSVYDPVLGSGATGDVYFALSDEDRGDAKRGEPLAIKLYRNELLGDSVRRGRIDREFRTGVQLRHPNLVRTLDHSKSGSDLCYLVMEYVDGVPLGDWIAQFQPVPGRLLLRFSQQLLDCLEYLHANGVIHRDLKPNNIMVTSSFDLKVMDLGLALGPSSSTLTPSGSIVGTLRNLPPELVQGGTEADYNAKTDLYSLGTVFYALLHGFEVFHHITDSTELLTAVRDACPSHQDLAKVDDPVRSRLIEITKRLLAKLPSDRYASCEEVRKELAALGTSSGHTSEPLHGYIATALTGVSVDAREALMFVAKQIVDSAKQYDLYVYQPRIVTDPVVKSNIDAASVYRLDRERVLRADVLVLVANTTSFGVGQELEIATAASIPVLLVARVGAQVSRMVTGCPANCLEEIRYNSPEDLDLKLRICLQRHMPSVRRYRQTIRSAPKRSLGNQLRSLRRAGRRFPSGASLAQAIGVSPRLVEALERGDCELISLTLLDRIAAALGVPLQSLIDPAELAPREQRMQIRWSEDALRQVARRLGWPAADYLDLIEEYRGIAASGKAENLKSGDWEARHAALLMRRSRG